MTTEARRSTDAQATYRLLDLWLARRNRPGWERRAEALRRALVAAIGGARP